MQNKGRPLISVIMPVYNTEKYLTESIESIINQSYANWELICVDDGSTDNSWYLLQKFAERDNRIKIFTQPHKGTASAARNKALEHSTGEFVAMLDSDDKYESDALFLIQKRIQDTNADFILFNLCFCSQNLDHTIKELKGYKGDTSAIISGRTAFIESLDWKIGGCGAIHEKVIKKFKYNETGMNGDELSTRIFFLNSETVAFSEAKYLYRNYIDSTSNRFSLKKFYVLDTDLALLKISFESDWAKHLLPLLGKRYFSKIFFTQVDYFQNRQNLSQKEQKTLKEYILKHFIEAKNFNIDLIKEVPILQKQNS
jgi:glycosyltransferase involved in cell wall biosynthesis